MAPTISAAQAAHVTEPTRRCTLSKFDMALVTVCQMRDHVTSWADLCSRAVEDNAYFSPLYALALLDTVARDKDIVFLTAWEGDRLMALLPVMRPRRALPGVLFSSRAWTTDYTFSANPVLDAQSVNSAADAIVEGLALLCPSVWTIPTVNIEGPAGVALIAALERRRIPWVSRSDFWRASLTHDLTFEMWMEDVLGTKRRRDLARNRRRLAELGTVTHEVHTTGSGLRRGVEAFLTLEASGWKGKRGTALACKPETRDFALKAFSGEQKACKSRVDLLLLNDRPIAAGVIVFAGETGFTVKGAYEEEYSRFSAGLLLEVEVLKSFLENKWAKRLDAATAGAHVIDRFWPERVKVADLIFSTAPVGAAIQVRLHTKMLDVRQRLKDVAKRVLKR